MFGTGPDRLLGLIVSVVMETVELFALTGLILLR